MKKMALNLEALAVESFVTDAPSGRGTVVGAERVANQITQPKTSEIDACPSAWGCTVGATCDFSCGDSCNSCQSCDFASGCGCSGPIC